MILKLLLVGFGGGVGSVMRYLLSLLTAKNNPAAWPLSTFIVNMFGCLLIGLLVGLFARLGEGKEGLELLFITGFCGGFTTFSAFSAESLQLWQSGNQTVALLYVALSSLIGVLAVYFGTLITR